jgi:cyclophilin family peptidyl-prolyl cis-trans isomerase
MRFALALALAAAPVAAADVPSPGEIVAAAPAAEWVGIAAEDLLVMTLAPDAKGRARRVVIQLMPAPFSQGWVGNIRVLAKAHWWDGTAVTRVQDNYVAQWGDPTEKKALPAGLRHITEADYDATSGDITDADIARLKNETEQQEERAWSLAAARIEPRKAEIASTRNTKAPQGWHERDAYAEWVEVRHGWPLAASGEGMKAIFWPVHCYGMVGVGRNLSPDTGTGAELYTVIGHAPRHLDRNIALVGRVVEGMEHLSSLPRGTGALGVYETAAERTPIVSIRLASELAATERPRLEYLSTDSASFARYVAARANRRDAFFIRPAGGVDVCNMPVPVRRAGAKQ